MISTCEPDAPITDALRVWPLQALRDGRKPTITSAYGKRGLPPRRKMHWGADIMVPWLASDPDWPGSVKRLGMRRFTVPPGTLAFATEAGLVVLCGWISSGFRAWIRGEESGLYIGQFHLEDLRVEAGQRVGVAQPLGLVGSSPLDKQRARHYHLQVAQGGPRNELSIDPAPYLRGAVILPASPV